MTRLPPTLKYETAWWSCGVTRIAGIDEAGRGAWAGPVVAAAVILPRTRPMKTWWRDDTLAALENARDSKLLSPKQRQALVSPIHTVALACATGSASHTEIDALGIVPATRLAMQRALASLPVPPEALLIDAVKLPAIDLPQKAIIHGDQLSLSIACASILAKTTRDALMREMDAQYPGYGFAQHKGYGTARHRAVLRKLGATPAHRMTFAPLKSLEP